MKRILIIACLILLIPAVGWGFWWAAGRSAPYAWCPSDYIFAWDISTGGKAFLKDFAVNGQNSNGTMVDGQYWMTDADNDAFVWTVPASWYPSDTIGFTVWAEIYINTLDVLAISSFFQFKGNNQNFYVMAISANDKHTSAYYNSNNNDNKDSTNTTAKTSWITVGGSHLPSGGGNDAASTESKTVAFAEAATASGSWAVGIYLSAIQLGSDLLPGSVHEIRIRRVVILPGYKRACPW